MLFTFQADHKHSVNQRINKINFVFLGAKSIPVYVLLASKSGFSVYQCHKFKFLFFNKTSRSEKEWLVCFS